MSRRAIIQRGDLLRALGVAGPRAAVEERDGVASLCGYQRITEATPDTFRPPPDEPTERQSLAKGGAEAPGNRSGPVLRAHPEYLVARSAESVAPAPEGDDFEGEWAWLNRSATAEDLEVRDTPSPPVPPLMPWARLWPGLRETLGVRRPTGAVDSRALVAAAARLRPLLGRLPRRRRLAWARQATILIDGRPQLAPFREDVGALLEALHACRGREGLEVWCLPEGDPAGEAIRYGTGELGKPRYPPGAPMLAVGDLGCLESGSGAVGRWLELGRSRRRTGGVPAALLPCSPDRWDDRLARLWVSTAWDRGERPRRGGQSAKPRTSGESSAAGERGARLLDLVSPAVRCEPGLLRRLARLLPRQVAGAGDEYDAWNHPEVRASDLAMALLPDAAARRRARLATESAELRKAVAREILEFHVGCASTVRAAETLNLAEAAAFDDPTALGSARQAFERLIARVFATVRERDALRARTQGLMDWCPRGLEQVSTARGGLQLPAAVARAALQHWEGRTVRRAAAELDPAGVSAITDKLLEDPGRDSLWEVLWGAAGLAVRRAESRLETKSDRRPSPGIPVALVRARRLRFDVRVVPRGEGASPTDYRWLPDGDEFAMPVAEAKEIRISTDRARVGLARILCPPWADRFGQDRFGTYAEFVVGAVRFRWRWIPPGTFRMGSPEDEAGRFEDEGPQHRVTITRGFWLGETPVTQQQWVALMGNNPSAATGDLLPVESVDWEMSMIYCQRLRERIPDLEFRLPTEAEWEYACRAGTQSAFHDGSACTKPEGSDPALDRPGWYGENSGRKTHPVGEKAPNAWGLYDVHGNVWEWCLDEKRRYEMDEPNGCQDDPAGAVDTRAGHVVRGGSAWSGAMRCRSASRLAIVPGFRDRFLGFRLAAGQPGDAGEPDSEGGRGMVPREGGEARDVDAPALAVSLITPPLKGAAGRDPRFGYVEFIGRPFEVGIEVRNTGSVPSEGTVLSCSVPAALTFRSASGSGVHTAGSVRWDFGCVKQGAAKRVSVTFSASSAGSHVLVANVLGMHAKPVSTSCDILIAVADRMLVEAVSSPRTIGIGEFATFTFRATNTGGGGDLVGVVLAAVFSEALDPLEPSHGGGVTDRLVVWPLVPRLQPRQTLTYTVRAKGIVAGEARADVQVTASPGTLIGSALAPATVTEQADPQVRLQAI